MWLRPFLSKVSERELSIFETHFHDLMAALPTDGSAFDLQPLLTDFVTDIVTHAFIGQSSGILSRETNGDTDAASAEGRNFGVLHQKATDGLVSDEYNLLKLVPALRGNVDRDRSAREANDALARMVDRATAPEVLAAGGASPILEAAAREGRDPERVVWDLMGLISAGKDSTSAALGNLMHCLARDPEVVRRLQEDVRFLDGRPPTIAQLAQLGYFRDVVNEGTSTHHCKPESLPSTC